ncbi:sensor histidine kinase [Methylobacterium longum]|uniref:Blue-light-activated histidine kinase n=1 Tax=Methylobacterium longum TaxID=767694 RepID=A0ABT8ARK8_9HYPH|nr:HWE histidine kinase domain-containing protein [Methylobacterium longum]MDN3572385.1 HWE histidine kinase domain-containing protein [Methylobacterium longum]GJE09472.1 Blue-light-activated histidine kinase [Methylobacterium longum]
MNTSLIFNSGSLSEADALVVFSAQSSSMHLRLRHKSEGAMTSGRRGLGVRVTDGSEVASPRSAREAELEAEIGRLRRSLDEAVRRTASEVPAATAGHEREIADARADLALAQARIAELEQANAELTASHAVLAASEARYRLAVESASDYAIFTTDLTGRITAWHTGAQNLMGWTEEEAVGAPANLIFTPEDDREATAETEMRLAVTEGRGEDDRWHLRKDGTRFWANGLMMPLRDDEGGLAGFLKILRDRTEQKRAAERQALLLHELNHRVKNTLATVQAFSSQTLRTASSLSEARESITARLIALAQAHDVLTAEDWEGADIAKIVADALRLHGGDGERCRWQGNALRVAPRIALAISMMLHELTTNAIKYGALSNATGTVLVTWTTQEAIKAGQELQLHFRWQESGGPPVRPPARKGFGSRLIERGLANELGGEARVLYEPQGVVCTLDVPLELG